MLWAAYMAVFLFGDTFTRLAEGAGRDTLLGRALGAVVDVLAFIPGGPARVLLALCASYSRHGFRRRSAAAGQRAPDSISTARRLCGGVSKARRMPLLKKRRASVMQNGLSFKNTMSRVGLCYFVLMLVTQALQLAGMTLLGSLLETGGGCGRSPMRRCIALPSLFLSCCCKNSCPARPARRAAPR